MKYNPKYVVATLGVVGHVEGCPNKTIESYQELSLEEFKKWKLDALGYMTSEFSSVGECISYKNTYTGESITEFMPRCKGDEPTYRRVVPTKYVLCDCPEDRINIFAGMAEDTFSTIDPKV